MTFFHGEKQAGPYFEGWYFKHQNRCGQALALIPALHIDRSGRPTASVQVISKENTWWLEYPADQFQADRGRSFPSAYLWTQCIWGGPGAGALMLAAATVPLPVGSFTGCICSVFYGGREYRLATYRGAVIEEWSPSGAVIRQGKYRLKAELLSSREQALRAPAEGRMERTIHESLCARVRYGLWHGAMGIVMGASLPEKHRKTAVCIAGGVFVATYLPLMAKFFRIVAGKEGNSV